MRQQGFCTLKILMQAFRSITFSSAYEHDSLNVFKSQWRAQLLKSNYSSLQNRSADENSFGCYSGFERENN